MLEVLNPLPRRRIGRASIDNVVAQHVEDSAAARHTRSVLVRAPHVGLRHLRRLDDRIAAHLDGLLVAGADGWRLAVAALESPAVGHTFTAAALAILNDNPDAFDKLLSLAQSHEPAARGLRSALGWVSAQSLRGVVAALLGSPDAFHRNVGVAACAMHRVDPAAALNAALASEDRSLRARALCVAGEVGRLDCMPACLSALEDDDSEVRYQAARTCVLMGDRNASIASIRTIAASSDPRHPDGRRLLLKLTTSQQSQAVLREIAAKGTQIRSVVQGVGIAGNPNHVPWLIEQMTYPSLTRLAAESFTLITGLDLADCDLVVKPPDGISLGPSDDPSDDDVALDADDGLPWPDPVKIADWWTTNGSRFISDRRYFMGEEPSEAHCLRVLRGGFQRQRVAAAEYGCLMSPGTRLFPTAAPAWRQERWLED